MNSLVALIGAIGVATTLRQRAARHRQAAGVECLVPAALRNADGDESCGRWIHGSLNLGVNPAVSEARRDSANTVVVLDPARFRLERIRSGLPDSWSIAPGMQVLQLRSATGAVDVAMRPTDAQALTTRFRGGADRP